MVRFFMIIQPSMINLQNMISKGDKSEKGGSPETGKVETMKSFREFYERAYNEINREFVSFKGYPMGEEIMNNLTPVEMNSFNVIEMDVFQLSKNLKLKLAKANQYQIKTWLIKIRTICDQIQKFCKGVKLDFLFGIFEKVIHCLTFLMTATNNPTPVETNEKKANRKISMEKKLHRRGAVYVHSPKMVEMRRAETLDLSIGPLGFEGKNNNLKKQQYNNTRRLRLGGVSLYLQNHKRNLERLNINEAYFKICEEKMAEKLEKLGDISEELKKAQKRLNESSDFQFASEEGTDQRMELLNDNKLPIYTKELNLLEHQFQIERSKAEFGLENISQAYRTEKMKTLNTIKNLLVQNSMIEKKKISELMKRIADLQLERSELLLRVQQRKHHLTTTAVQTAHSSGNDGEIKQAKQEIIILESMVQKLQGLLKKHNVKEMSLEASLNEQKRKLELLQAKFIKKCFELDQLKTELTRQRNLTKNAYQSMKVVKTTNPPPQLTLKAPTQFELYTREQNEKTISERDGGSISARVSVGRRMEAKDEKKDRVNFVSIERRKNKTKTLESSHSKRKNNQNTKYFKSEKMIDPPRSRYYKGFRSVYNYSEEQENSLNVPKSSKSRINLNRLRSRKGKHGLDFYSHAYQYTFFPLGSQAKQKQKQKTIDNKVQKPSGLNLKVQSEAYNIQRLSSFARKTERAENSRTSNERKSPIYERSKKHRSSHARISLTPDAAQNIDHSVGVRKTVFSCSQPKRFKGILHNPKQTKEDLQQGQKNVANSGENSSRTSPDDKMKEVRKKKLIWRDNLIYEDLKFPMGKTEPHAIRKVERTQIKRVGGYNYLMDQSYQFCGPSLDTIHEDEQNCPVLESAENAKKALKDSSSQQNKKVTLACVNSAPLVKLTKKQVMKERLNQIFPKENIKIKKQNNRYLFKSSDGFQVMMPSNSEKQIQPPEKKPNKKLPPSSVLMPVW